MPSSRPAPIVMRGSLATLPGLLLMLLLLMTLLIVSGDRSIAQEPTSPDSASQPETSEAEDIQPASADEQVAEPADHQTNSKFLATSTVGMPAHLRQFVIAGPELTAKPLSDRHQPFILRVEQIFQHGSDHRYDLEFYALEPGTYDLRDYLTRDTEDGSDWRVSVQPLLVRVESQLPAGQITPKPLQRGRLPVLGGYRLMMVLAGVLWLVGLFVLIFSRKKRKEDPVTATAPRLTVADRLRPLIEQARDGKLTTAQEAELERTLIAFWCHRLQLQGLGPAAAFDQLKQHAQAGPLLVQLEQWLHNPAADKTIDLRTLLAPYEAMAAEQWDAEDQVSTNGPQLETAR